MGRRKRKRNRNLSEEGSATQSSGNPIATTSSGPNTGSSSGSNNGGSGQNGQGGKPLSNHDRRARSNAQNATVRSNVPNQQQNTPVRPSGSKLQLPPKPGQAVQNAPRQEPRTEKPSSDPKPSKKKDAEPKIDDAWEEDLEGTPLGWQFKIGALAIMALLGFGGWVGYQYFFGPDDEAGNEQIADNESPNDPEGDEGEEPSPPTLPSLDEPELPIIESPLPETPAPAGIGETSDEGREPWNPPHASAEPGSNPPSHDPQTDIYPQMRIPDATDVANAETLTPSLDMWSIEPYDYTAPQPSSPLLTETPPPVTEPIPSPNMTTNLTPNSNMGMSTTPTPIDNPSPNPADAGTPPPPAYSSQPERTTYPGGYAGGYGDRYGENVATSPSPTNSRPPSMNVSPPATYTPPSMSIAPGGTEGMAPIALPGASPASYEAVMPPSLPSPDANESDYRQYTVLQGDTLFSIAERELGRRSGWVDVFMLNKDSMVSDPDRLRVGSTILLPAAGSVEATAGRGRGAME
jgi:hypothetical protein